MPHPAAARHWHRIGDGRIQCDLCPRFCRLREGQRGLCFVRQRHADALVLTTWGRSSGFAVDPIEKKPLYHFYPGSRVLSFGTAGCNLACKFCQNWDISKSREMDQLGATALPDTIAEAARKHGCRSVAFTYNDPVIFHEYALDVARACRKQNIQSVAVTAGYISECAREEFFSAMDGVNVDLKAFDPAFYYRLCGGKLQTVLDTLCHIYHQTSAWLEITTLLIPGKNDSNREITAMVEWIGSHLGDQVPLHFTAFHPDWKMRELPRTPHATLTRARRIALDRGLRHVYVGNVHDRSGATTHCVGCGRGLIVRDWHRIVEWHLDHQGNCPWCGYRMSGHVAGPPDSDSFRPYRVSLSG